MDNLNFPPINDARAQPWNENPAPSTPNTAQEAEEHSALVHEILEAAPELGESHACPLCVLFPPVKKADGR